METQELDWKWKGMKVGNYGSEGKRESKHFDGVCGRVTGGGTNLWLKVEEGKEEERKNKEDKEVVEER